MTTCCVIAPPVLLFGKKIIVEVKEYEHLSRQIFESALEVHRYLGAGLLESAYQAAFEMELSMRGIGYEAQVKLPLYYKGMNTGKDFIIDLLIEDQIIVELKALETLLPVHLAQILSYLKLARLPLGFLINFNVPLIKDGFKRVVNNYPERFSSAHE